MKTEFKIVSGIELETEYNADLLGHIHRSSYHGYRNHETPKHYDDLKNFACENDGSLESTTFENGDTVEIISRPFELKKARKILKAFQNATFKRISQKLNISIEDASKYELNEIFSFNISTGSHVHYSLYRITDTPKTKRFYTRGMFSKFEHAEPLPFKAIAQPRFYIDLNNKVIEKVKQHAPKCFNKFKRGFYREYAREISEHQTTHNISAIRTMSHNLSVDGFEHVEFRSFNLRGVQTWSDLFNMFDALISAFYEHFNDAYKNGFAITTEDTINEPPKTTIYTETEEIEITNNNELIELQTLEINNEEDF